MIDRASNVTYMSFDRPPGGYLSINEVCEYLGISHPTLYRWLKQGLPSHQINPPRGRRLFVQAEVDAWICSRWSANLPSQTA